jgi:hypothetical protein
MEKAIKDIKDSQIPNTRKNRAAHRNRIKQGVY